MAHIFKQRFFWQFVTGFVLGTAGMLTLQPTEAAAAVDTYVVQAR
jgi:hypothetical protein